MAPEPWRLPSLLGLRGLFWADIDRGQRPAGAGHELLDLQLGAGEQRSTAFVKGDAALVQGDRALEGQAARLELGNGLLELPEGVVEGQALDRGVSRLRHGAPRHCAPRAAAGAAPAGSRMTRPSATRRTIA